MAGTQEPLSTLLPVEGTCLELSYASTSDRCATCSSSGVVQIWGFNHGDAGRWRLLYRQQVPQPGRLAWADPEFGSTLAVGSGSGAVYIFQAPNTHTSQWHQAAKIAGGKGGVQALEFAPREHGLLLAAGGADGGVRIHEGLPSPATGRVAWTLLNKLQACDSGPCCSLCWRPFSSGLPPLLVASSDQGAAVWCYDSSLMGWKRAGLLASPGSPQPAVALDWAPTHGRPHELCAASFGSAVVVYRVSGKMHGLQVAPSAPLQHPASVWRLSFSRTGMMLACSLDDSPEVWFWGRELGGPAWVPVSRVKGGAPALPAPGAPLALGGGGGGGIPGMEVE